MKLTPLFLSLLFSLQVLLLSPLSSHARTPASSSPLKDVKYDFTATKVAEAESAYKFLRAFVDYFYLLTQANQKSLPSLSENWGTSAWCVGDAHQENFGFILLDNDKSVFTMNDFDDAGPCPAVLDLYRFMVAARLMKDDIKLSPLMDAYLAGLQLQGYKMPKELKMLQEKSQEKGRSPRESKINGSRLIRDNNTAEVPAAQQKEIQQALAYLKAFLKSEPQILDMIATSKIGGGSGGLQRYEVLLGHDGQQTHLELKEQSRPAIYPVATSPIPSVAERLQTTLQNTQGSKSSFYYQTVEIAGKSMLIRPRFAGNIGFSLGKKVSDKDLEVVLYEAYTLGLIHARSITNTPLWAKALQGLPQKKWEQDVDVMVRQFKTKFAELKP